MPQLEIADFAPQVFWLFVTFVTLYLIMARAALPRVADTLRTREERISDDLDRAQRLNEEAQGALETYEQSLARARSEAHELALKTRNDVQADIKAKQTEAEGELARRADEAEARIKESRDAAMANVRDIASAAASDIVAKLVGAAPSAGAVEASVGSELTSRGLN